MATTLDPRLPVHLRVHDDLAARIAAGEWGPDEPLPPESQLVGHYQVSMGTIRKVLAELVADGLIERHQGRGTFVRRISLDQSLFRFFRAGGPDEAAPIGRIRSRARAVAPAEVADRLQVEPGSDVLHLERLRERGGEAFLFEHIWLPLPRMEVMASAGEQVIGNLLYPAYERLCGVMVAKAEEELTVVMSEPTAAAALHRPEQEPMVRIRRVARTHSGEVVEYRESFGPAADFVYRVEIN